MKTNLPRSILSISLVVLLSITAISQEDTSMFHPSPLILKDKVLEENADNEYKASIKANRFDLSIREIKTLKNQYKKRREYFLQMLQDGDLIVSGALYDYTQNILNKVTASVNIPNKKLFIVRENSPNAFNMGDNNIFIHLGLIFHSKSEDELAYVIAHELGHNELSHYDNSILEFVTLKHNDSINNRIKQIKKLKYGNVSALNKLMIPWLLVDKSNSRRDEHAADAYALKSVIEIGYDLTKIIEIYDVFERQGKQKDTVLFNFEKLFDLDLEESDFSNAFEMTQNSSLGTFKKQKKKLEDELRTHPFNEERKDIMIDNMTEENEQKLNKNGIGLKFAYYKKLAHNEIIADALHSLNLNDAIFYSILLYNEDKEALFPHEIIPASFTLLGYEKIKRRAGKRIPIKSPYFDNNYNQLVHFLREISPQQCFDIANNWSKNHRHKITSEISNPNLLIKTFINENYSNYKIRHQLALEKKNNYYLKPLLQLINTEYKNR